MEMSVAREAGSNSSASEIKSVFELQKTQRWRISNISPKERIVLLKKLRSAILRRQDELKAALFADFRKPAFETELTELQPVIGELTHTIKHLEKWAKPQRAPTPLTLFSSKGFVRYEPKGVVLILSPWNYPFNLMLCPLIAAVAAGNCVIARPSDKVPRTSQFIKSLAEEVFAREHVAVFTGPSSIANTLLELPFDHVFFTGSTRIGKHVMESAANHLASVTLELGGQSPVVIDETADITQAAECVTWGKYLNAGQTCVAPNHVFVHESKAAEFIAETKRIIERNYGQNEEARRKSGDFARIVDSGSHKRLTDMISQSVASGARVEIGGKHDFAERFIAPTVLSNVTLASPAMKEEIFGPILPVIAYRSIEEVFTAIRSRGKPLAMYIFSQDAARTHQIMSNTTAGGTVLNNVIIHLANPDLPFGGIGESGFGNYHGQYGFKTFSHERAVVKQGWLNTVKFFYPPYTPRVARMLAWVTRFLSF